MVHTILTHPGGAHKDEVLALCVLIAKHRARIVRREPTPEELDDPAIAIVDIGGVHDPGRMCFDHHQFPREHPPTCSLSLVLEALGLYEDAREFCQWLEPAEWLDSRGPNRTADWLGVPRAAIGQLNSPIDLTLLRRFAKASELAPGDTLYEFMRLIGEDLLEYLRTTRERLDQVAEAVEQWSIEHEGTLIEAVFLPRTKAEIDEPSAALARYVRSEGLEDAVAALVYPDRRGEGYGIARYEDHASLDFSTLGDESDVRFAHKSGFMCKTTATDPARLRQLITRAWRTP